MIDRSEVARIKTWCKRHGVAAFVSPMGHYWTFGKTLVDDLGAEREHVAEWWPVKGMLVFDHKYKRRHTVKAATWDNVQAEVASRWGLRETGQ